MSIPPVSSNQSDNFGVDKITLANDYGDDEFATKLVDAVMEKPYISVEFTNGEWKIGDSVLRPPPIKNHTSLTGIHRLFKKIEQWLITHTPFLKVQVSNEKKANLFDFAVSSIQTAVWVAELKKNIKTPTPEDIQQFILKKELQSTATAVRASNVQMDQLNKVHNRLNEFSTNLNKLNSYNDQLITGLNSPNKYKDATKLQQLLDSKLKLEADITKDISEFLPTLNSILNPTNDISIGSTISALKDVLSEIDRLQSLKSNPKYDLNKIEKELTKQLDLINNNLIPALQIKCAKQIEVTEEKRTNAGREFNALRDRALGSGRADAKASTDEAENIINPPENRSATATPIPEEKAPSAGAQIQTPLPSPPPSPALVVQTTPPPQASPNVSKLQDVIQTAIPEDKGGNKLAHLWGTLMGAIIKASPGTDPIEAIKDLGNNKFEVILKAPVRVWIDSQDYIDPDHPERGFVQTPPGGSVFLLGINNKNDKKVVETNKISFHIENGKKIVFDEGIGIYCHLPTSGPVATLANMLGLDKFTNAQLSFMEVEGDNIHFKAGKVVLFKLRGADKVLPVDKQESSWSHAEVIKETEQNGYTTLLQSKNSTDVKI